MKKRQIEFTRAELCDLRDAIADARLGLCTLVFPEDKMLDLRLGLLDAKLLASLNVES